VGVSVASTSTANHSHGFNTRQRWHSRPFGGVVVHLLGVGSLWWLFGGFLAVCCSAVPSTDRQKADKGRKIPLCATFPPSVGCRSASVGSVPCRLSIGFLGVCSLSGCSGVIPPAVGVVGVCILNKGRFVGGGFRLMNGKGLRIGKRPAVEVGAVASSVALLAGVILEGVGLGGEFAVE